MLAVLLLFLVNLFNFQPQSELSSSNQRYSDTLPAIITQRDTIVLADSVVIKNIYIEGNRKTKQRIILREVALKSGDKIAREDLDKILEKEASKILNTKLFVIAKVVPQYTDENNMNLIISVIEKWYLYPMPILDIADRNLNEWLQQRNRDLTRLVYGIRFHQQNFRGRNEDLRFTLQFGFTRNFDFDYRIPYLDRKQTIGINFRIGYSDNKSIAYKTHNNKLEFTKSENLLRERFSTSLSLQKRSKFYNTHSVELKYNRAKVADTIALLNPDYFLNGKTTLQYAEVSYTFSREMRDNVAYPLKGKWFQVNTIQRGLTILDDLNQFELRFIYAKFFQLSKAFYLSSSIRGLTSFPQRQPYSEMRAFGYSQNFVRGYDLYVIDAQHFATSKNTLRWQLVSTTKKLDKFVKIEQFSTLPIAIYLKAYYDLAYASNSVVTQENKKLTNKLLWGTGAGLDIVLYNEFVFRLEYSLNSLMERGFFFNVKSDF